MPPALRPRKCEWGLGQSPRAFFVFEVVRVDVTVQKGQKNVHFRIFATKNTANLANLTPPPHANRGE